MRITKGYARDKGYVCDGGAAYIEIGCAYGDGLYIEMESCDEAMCTMISYTGGSTISSMTIWMRG